MANGFFNTNHKLEPSYLGAYGDFIGGFLGTVLTIIATVYIYKTYHSQKKELKSQKKELQLQRKLIAQQQFENTFFNMLNVHRELKNGLRYTEQFIGFDMKNPQYHGLETINAINKKLRLLYTKATINKPHEVGTVIDFELEKLNIDLSKYQERNDKNILKVSYGKLFEIHQNQISHYCRNVYHILKFIRENEKNETLGKEYNKYKSYANIFQSQLNVDEQFLLFYNFLHFDKETDDEIFQTINLVNHYSFLENIGIDNLISKKHELFYNFLIKGSDRKFEK